MHKKLLIALSLMMLVAGCSTGIDYKPLEAQMATGNCEAASGYVEASAKNYGKKQQLLYHMDTGMVNLYCGNLEKSSEGFLQAEHLAQDLWTKSITSEGASYLTNDYAIAYSGEDFEKVMINLFHSLAFASKGDFEGALIEARKLNEFLTEINDKFDDDEKNAYKEDAFARYLSAVLYEADNPRDMQNLDSAVIDYELGLKAYESYAGQYGVSAPKIFIEDYYRVAEAAGRLKGAKKKYKKVKWIRHKKARKMGRVVMLHLSGKSPLKKEEAIVSHGPHGPIKIAFPKFVARPMGCTDSSLIITDGNGTEVTSQSELVEDLTSIAIKNLANRKGRVVAKAIARAIVKQIAVHAAAKQAKSEAGKLGMKLFGSLVAAATEVADVRSWRTLPGRIYMARNFVPEGSYTIKANYCGTTKILAEGVELAPGETKFVLLENVY